MSRMCVFSSRDIAANSYVAFLGFFLLCINLHLDVIARGFDPAVDENPTLKYDKDVRCGYHAIRMVARLLKCDQAIHDKIPLDAPALSVAECIEQLEAIELSVEPAKLIGDIFAAVDNGVSERDDGCVAILLLFGTEQTELDIGHFFVCFRSDDSEMLLLDPTENKVVPFDKISGGPANCICLFVSNDTKKLIPKRIERFLGFLCWTGALLVLPFLILGRHWSFRSYIPWACVTCLGGLLFHSSSFRNTLTTPTRSPSRSYSVLTNNPVTKSEELILDIGTGVENEHIDFALEWTNRFAKPVRMLRLSPSCSCIRLQFDTAPISPGELFKGKGTISLTGVGVVDQSLVGSLQLYDGTEREFLKRIRGQAERDLSIDVTRSSIGIIRPGASSNPISLRWRSTSQTYRFVSFGPKDPSNTVLKIDPVILNEDQLGFEVVFRSDGQSNQLGSFSEKWHLTFDDHNGKRVVLPVTVEGIVQNGPMTMPDSIVMYDGERSIVNLYVPSGLPLGDVVTSIEPVDFCDVEVAAELHSNEVWSIGKLSCTVPKSESTDLRTGRIVFRDRLTLKEMSEVQLYVFPDTPKQKLVELSNP